MDIRSVLEYTIPYQHALAVHFPLVLLLLAGGAALVYAVRGTAVWRQAMLWLLGLGTITAFWAKWTGPALLESMEGTPIVERLVETHESGALWTVVLGSLAFVVALGATVWLRRQSAAASAKEPLWVRLLVLAIAGLAAVAVAWTAHVGGVMVWGVTSG